VFSPLHFACMHTHMHTVCVHDYTHHRNLQNHNNDV
jgi:hypothetical protein